MTDKEIESLPKKLSLIVIVFLFLIMAFVAGMSVGHEMEREVEEIKITCPFCLGDGEITPGETI